MTYNDDLLRGILKGNPSSETILTILAVLKEKGDLKNIIDACHEALERYPDNIHIRKYLADAYFEDGRISEAGPESENIIQGINELMPVYLIHANFLIGQKREKEAIETLKLFLHHFPDHEEANSLMESLRSGADEVCLGPDKTAEEKAEELLPPLKDELPEIATPTLAEIFFDQGKMEKAVEIYEKIIRKNPDDQHSKQRFNEISAMINAAGTDKTSKEDNTAQKKEKIIAVLESWLDGIRKNAGYGSTV